MGKYPESIDNITKARLRFSAFGSILSIALTMFLIGLLVFFAFFSTRYIRNISKKIELEVLFYSDIREADIVALEQRMKLEPSIASSRVSSREENTREAIKTIGNNYTEIITNPINASIIASVNPEYANADSLAVISKNIKKNAAVQDVQYPQFLVSSFYNNRTYQLVILCICAVFMVISMLLIANSIRLNIYAKRFNIKSMLLVGATRSFVRRPYLFKGLVQGVWGGFIAILLIALVLYEGNTFVPDFFDFSNILYITLILIGIFLFSVLFTMFVSFISVNKYIKMKADRLYL